MSKRYGNTQIKVRVFFRLCNVSVVGFYYLFNFYMFRSYDHLQTEIYLLEISSKYIST
jgi:hypothetical protein